MNIVVTPNLNLAKSLFSNASERLWKSFDYLLETNNLSHHPFASLTNKLRDNPKAPPFFFAAHHLILGYCTHRQSPDRYLVSKILGTDSYSHYEHLSILPFLSTPDLQESVYQKTIYSDITDTYNDVQFLPIAFDSANELKPTKSTIKSALNIIKLADPELYDEIEFLTNEIRVFSSGNIRAGSNFNTLGLIYMSQQGSSDEVSRYIEHIVHEAAHNLLYAHWTADPIFTNHSNKLYYTPFRRDSRPLSAIFHAMFVLARTIYIFDKIHLNAPNSLDFGNIRTNYNERGNNASFKIKFIQTAEVVSKNAKLTAYGKRIFDGCLQMVNDCKLNI